MRYDDVWIAGTGAYAGERFPVATAVTQGRVEEHLAEGVGAVSVAQSNLAPPEMAVIAGREAVGTAARTGTVASTDTTFIHSYTNFQGIEFWPTECWLAGQLLGEKLTTLPTSICAGSNGSLACLSAAADLLKAHADVPSVLITAADRFPAPWDRWHLSPGMFFGDGAAAAVLTRGNGKYKLDSLATRTDTALEGLARGAENFAISSPLEKPNSARRTREFLSQQRMSLRQVRSRSADGVREVTYQALSEAGVTIEQIDWCITPFVGKTLHEQGFMEPLGNPRAGSLQRLGLTLGHLGPADGLYALDHLLKQGMCHTGHKVVVIGTGMGFTFGAAVFTVSANQ